MSALEQLWNGGREALSAAAARHRAALVVLFGSTARGTRRADSDLDFAVVFAGSPREEGWLDEEAALRDDLEEVLQLRCRLDLVVLNTADAPLLKNVAAEGIPLYEGAPGEWLRFRIRARKEYEDTEKYRRRRWAAAARRLGVVP